MRHLFQHKDHYIILVLVSTTSIFKSEVTKLLGTI